jgi:hypothetical protein
LVLGGSGAPSQVRRRRSDRPAGGGGTGGTGTDGVGSAASLGLDEMTGAAPSTFVGRDVGRIGAAAVAGAGPLSGVTRTTCTGCPGTAPAAIAAATSAGGKSGRTAGPAASSSAGGPSGAGSDPGSAGVALAAGGGRRLATVGVVRGKGVVAKGCVLLAEFGSGLAPLAGSGAIPDPSLRCARPA